jgi:hypothetical protein
MLLAWLNWPKFPGAIDNQIFCAARVSLLCAAKPFNSGWLSSALNWRMVGGQVSSGKWKCDEHHFYLK